MVTDEQLHTIMPRVSETRRTELLPFLQAAMTEFAIDKPPREAAFVAQLAHESGQFRFMEEIWGPTDAQRRYEPPSTLATRLGNTEQGDGKRFKGRGPIQITGRSNYLRFGSLLGVDLVADPPRAAVPDLAFRIAGLFWSKKGLNELADRASGDAFREITKRINGGLNGLADRERFYGVARTVLGVTEPVPRGLERELPATAPSAEPEFGRGHEAIRAFIRTRPARKGAAAARKRKTPRTKTASRVVTRKSGAAAQRPSVRSRAKKAATKASARKRTVRTKSARRKS
jgi:predicted chitinase